MILYFSGTGNSKYVAESLANILKETIHFIPAVNPSDITVPDQRIIFVFPIYSWGVPPLVTNFINRLPDSFMGSVRHDKIPIIMVATCGDEVAMAPEMFIETWKNRGVRVDAIWSILMPNNYVLLPGFDVDSTEVEQKKLDKAPSRIRDIADRINHEEWKFDFERGSWAKTKTAVVFPLFKHWGMNPKKWSVSEECVQCGRCAAACPLKNIHMSAGRPVWGNRCVSCTACYQHCPTRAISYRSFTNNKGQYFCHLHPLKS